MDPRERISPYVTSTVDSVYALTENLPTAIAAAAMARLSRCGDDMRDILLREFIPEGEQYAGPAEHKQTGRESELLSRIITAYGDDSVQQLGGLYVVVEAASALLIKALERGRVGASYLEQSTRYIYFDTKISTAADPKPHYRYSVPPELSEQSAAEYRTAMDAQFERYSAAVHRLFAFISENSSDAPETRDAAWRSAVRAQACDAARSLLPASTTSTVGIYASAQALDALIMRLRGHWLAEARQTGNALLSAVRQVMPIFFERTDLPDRGAATTAYLRNTADSVREFCAGLPGLSLKPSEARPGVELVDFWPKDERDLAGAIAFQAGYDLEAPLGLEDFAKLVNAYAGERLNRRHKLGRASENVNYTFRMRTSIAEWRDFQRHRLVDGFEWRRFRPGSDFELPELAKKAGLSELYLESFRESASLYSRLLEGFGEDVAQYAVLFGHKLDWRWTLNLREATHIIELRTTPQGHPAYRAICQQLFAEISRVHPILAKTIKFVNCGESPELARLAAERAAAFKLEKLNLIHAKE